MSNALIESNVHIILLIVDEVGHLLRADDPATLKQLIEKVQHTNENDSANNKDDSYRKFMLQNIYDLKNNKKKNEKVLERTNRLRKWVKHLQSGEGSVLSPFDIGWNDLLEAETKGRWWIVGGVWTGQRDKLAAAKTGSDRDKSNSNVQVKARGGVGNVLSHASSKLLDLARKQRMNTDIRRAIFCIIMDSNDYVDAFERLLSLNLNDRQERDIVHVIIRCCGSSKVYNPYFAHLSQRVCDYHHRFKFTFQLAYWDVFKQMEEMKETKLINLAKLLSHLILKFSLSMSVFKVVDFSFKQNGNKGICFFNAFFHTLLLHDDLRVVMKAFSRLGGSNDFLATSDGIQLFFHHHLLKRHSSQDINVSLLLNKRIKKVQRLLDFIATQKSRQKTGQDEDMEMM